MSQTSKGRAKTMAVAVRCAADVTCIESGRTSTRTTPTTTLAKPCRHPPRAVKERTPERTAKMVFWLLLGSVSPKKKIAGAVAHGCKRLGQ